MSRRRRGYDEKRSAVASQLIPMGPGSPVWSERDTRSLMKEAYTRNVVAYRCIKLLARTIARIPFILMNGKVEVEEHDILRLLTRPNLSTMRGAFLEGLLSYKLAAGNAYLEGVPLSRAPRFPVELYSHRPDRMTAVFAENGDLIKWRFQGVRGSYRDFDQDPIAGFGPILHLKEWHPLNDVFGFAPTEAAAMAIDQHNAGSRYNQALLQRGLSGSGAFAFKQRLEDAELKRVELKLEEKAQGVDRAGRPMVVGGEWSWIDFSRSARDAQFLEGQHEQARHICGGFGVPHVLVVPGEATYSNRDEAYLELHEASAIPMADNLAEALTGWLCHRWSDRLRLKVNYDEIPALASRRLVQHQAIREDYKEDLLTLNEARIALQWEEVPGGDKRKSEMSTANQLTITQATKPAVIAGPAGGAGGAGAAARPGLPAPRPRLALPAPARRPAGAGQKALYGLPGTYAYFGLQEASARALVAWAKAQGIKNVVPADDMHCTLIYSEVPVPAFEPSEFFSATIEPKQLKVDKLGDGSVLVLVLEDTWLTWRYEEAQRLGATSDWPEYTPHITISYDYPGTPALQLIKPPPFAIRLQGEFVEELEDEEGGKGAVIPFADQPDAEYNPKYNHYHDRHGRFTTGGGATFVSLRPGAGGALVGPKQPAAPGGGGAATGPREMGGAGLNVATRPAVTANAAAIEEKAKALLAQSKVYVAVQPTTLGKILDDGHFRSQLETGTSGGKVDVQGRAAFEKAYFGEHVIYGYMSTNGVSGPTSGRYPSGKPEFRADAAHDYGTARVEMRPSVKERTSFTQTDSWDNNKFRMDHSGSVDVIPSSVLAPSHRSFYTDKVTKADRIQDADHNYMEAQVRGGLTSSDIAQVTFYRKEPPAAITKKLKAKGIPWTFVAEYDA